MSGFDASDLDAPSWAETQAKQPVKRSRKITNAINYAAHCIFRACGKSS